ncbi:MAG TPA: UPF0158 family protein [Rhodothermales bacterium]|nr:UPF0158 family protein [Rhodothermales bacterium]
MVQEDKAGHERAAGEPEGDYVRVSLKEIVNELEDQNQDLRTFLNPRTGEVITISSEEEELATGQSGFDPAPWQMEILEKVREVLASDEYLLLPGSRQIHEWAIMEDFCNSVSDERPRGDLLQAIHGRGAFKNFRYRAERYGLLERWYAFRTEAIADIVREWLRARDIPFAEDL